jgi:hypothetical protein
LKASSSYNRFASIPELGAHITGDPASIDRVGARSASTQDPMSEIHSPELSAAQQSLALGARDRL